MAGRPSKGVRRQVLVRVEESTWAELILLRPDFQDANGYTKYGAINGYVCTLIREDIMRMKQKIRQIATRGKDE